MDLTRFRALMRRMAERLRREQSSKLLGGQGVDGRALRPKKRPNGRPLGFASSVTGIPGRLRRAVIRVTASAFSITHDDMTDWFDRGYAAQNRPPRPIVGASQAQRKRMLKDVADAIVGEASRLGLTKRRGRR